MNKAMAEILAGMIPAKMARNRWRGLLRYGVKKMLRLRRQVVKNAESKPSINLAVCAIAKNEGDYFKEWIDWHISVGVEKFYIYDNESTDQTREVLKPYIETGVVEYIYYPGYRMQIAAYDDCIERHRFDVRWLAFIDLDEFIVPVRDKDILSFLAKFDDAAAVEINWLVYGSSGLEHKTAEPVMQRFRRHAKSDHRLNKMVKSIVDPRKVCTMTGCHEAARLKGKAYDSHHQPIDRNFREREPLHDVIKINHYAVRSRQEFLEKQGRGRASGKKRNVPDLYFQEYDLNDVSD